MSYTNHTYTASENDEYVYSLLNLLEGTGSNTSGSTNLSFLGGGLQSGDTGVFRSVIYYIDLYVVPFMTLIGIVGNALSFTVFTCTYMKRLSSSIYLAALSLADIGFLLCVLVSWSMNVGVDIYLKNGWCQTFLYITYVSSFLSVWYVVSFTSERYVAVQYPLQRQKICTTKRSKAIVFSLALLAMLLYSFGIWTSGVDDLPLFRTRICGPKKEYIHIISIVNNVDTVMTLILPFLAILGMNVRIAFKVRNFYKQRKHVALQHCYTSSMRHLQHSQEGAYCLSYIQSSQTSVHNIVSEKVTKRKLYTKTQVRVTKMLLLVSSAFLILNLPRHTLRTYSFIMSVTQPKYRPSQNNLIWQKVFHFLYYLQFSMNVFLYSVFGKNFRKASLHLISRVKHKIKKCRLRPKPKPELDKAVKVDVVLHDVRMLYK